MGGKALTTLPVTLDIFRYSYRGRNVNFTPVKRGKS
jgi:hypothetical protein